MSAFAPRSDAELADWLRSRPGRVRLMGAGSRVGRAAPADGAHAVQLAGLDAIERLDAPDQTCTVGCGVRREALDDALRAHDLELPCPGGGTIGGLFAADPLGAASHAGHSPRSLLLGLEGVLADGTAFRSGARVVKSVAGYDVHKLFVGSEGRLYAATKLHLRLKPRPRAESWFAHDGLADAEALARLQALRAEPVAPAAVQLRRDGGGVTLVGRCAGRPTFVRAQLQKHALTESECAWSDHLTAPTGGEIVAGLARASALPGLFAALPATATLLWHGGGRFEAALPDAAASDALLKTAAAHDVTARVVATTAPARRERGSPTDPGAAHLAAALRSALDPHGILV
ncbi:MAG: FAD-binding oxidoreductase [Planctomycetes bacterium]|nr:FAD-binding oxidoreductase [Planctomycetota bacterium]